MTEHELADVLRIYEEAARRGGAERRAYLESACGPNQRLRHEVEALLAESSPSGDGFLETPPWQSPALSFGRRLGPYEIAAMIGAGGMGEVYRARDTRLGRDVAVKVLPLAAAADPDRMRRFEREARAVAALSHPHICTLHDIGSAAPDAPGGAGALNYLVMEYLEGETLAARLGRRPAGTLAAPLRVEDALEIGAQIAGALAAAHGAGIVHRDLKPANIMLVRTADGAVSVKLLDFGLARLAPRGDREAADISASVTGAVAGTVPYMSPEQAEGRNADARADVFAFGAVLYEMLTGRRAFDGASPAAVLAAILEHDPSPPSSVNPAVPPTLDRIVRRCLAKAPEARWQSAADLADELRWAAGSQLAAAAPTAAVRTTKRWLAAALFAAAGLGVGAAAAWYWHAAASPALPVKSELSVRPADQLDTGGFGDFVPALAGSRTAFAWTPDGQALVFAGREKGIRRLFVRRLDEDAARAIPGTDGAQAPAVSPDGRSIAFWLPVDSSPRALGTLKTVPLNGGPVETVRGGQPGSTPQGLDWGPGGRLAYGTGRVIVERVGMAAAKTLLPVAPTEGQQHLLPHYLPDGTVLFTIRHTLASWGREQVAALKPGSDKAKVLLEDAADARYVAAGHLVFMRRGGLLAVPFDPDRLEVTGNEVTLVGGVAQALAGVHARDWTGAGQFAVSSTGTLAYLAADDRLGFRAAVTRVDRSGRVTPLPFDLPAGSTFGLSVRVSSDGSRLALCVRRLQDTRLFVHDLGRPGSLQPVTTSGEVGYPQWQPGDGRVAVFSRDRMALGWATLGTGSPLEVLHAGSAHPSSWSPDGRYLAVVTASDDPMVIDFGDPSRSLRPLVTMPGSLERFPAFSPDGRWFAYTSNASGREEVWVRPFPGPGDARMVSAGGGTDPAWNPRGGELLYVTPVSTAGMHGVMSVAWRRDGSFGLPRKLFEVTDHSGFACGGVRCYDIARDGESFYAVQSTVSVPAVTYIRLIQNWTEELKAKVRPR